jgi:hypothetical protein
MLKNETRLAGPIYHGGGSGGAFDGFVEDLPDGDDSPVRAAEAFATAPQ